MIYFIRAGDTLAVKIGYCSGSPAKRMSELQTGCPLTLTLERVIKGHNAGMAGERYWHGLLHCRLLRGEWFALTKEEVQNVEKYSVYGCEIQPTPASRGLMEEFDRKVWGKLADRVYLPNLMRLRDEDLIHSLLRALLVGVISETFPDELKKEALTRLSMSFVDDL